MLFSFKIFICINYWSVFIVAPRALEMFACHSDVVMWSVFIRQVAADLGFLGISLNMENLRNRQGLL